MKTATAAFVAMVAILAGFRVLSPPMPPRGLGVNHVHQMGFAHWHAWSTQVDKTCTNPSQNPYMREAMFGLQNELPLRRIVINDKGFPAY